MKPPPLPKLREDRVEIVDTQIRANRLTAVSRGHAAAVWVWLLIREVPEPLSLLVLAACEVATRLILEHDEAEWESEQAREAARRRDILARRQAASEAEGIPTADRVCEAARCERCDGRRPGGRRYCPRCEAIVVESLSAEWTAARIAAWIAGADCAGWDDERCAAWKGGRRRTRRNATGGMGCWGKANV